jgi:hypothetical protein
VKSEEGNSQLVSFLITDLMLGEGVLSGTHGFLFEKEFHVITLGR